MTQRGAANQALEQTNKREDVVGLFSKLFGKSKGSNDTALAEAVAQDAAEAFSRFTSCRPNDRINAFALCSVDDASPPYIMGATLEEKFGPVGGSVQDGSNDTWTADPADWSWSAEGQPYRCGKLIAAILDQEDRPFEQRALQIFEGMVSGLKKFDASGQFQGRLPREQMILLLWINDPSEANAKLVMQWAAQLNPKPVSEWFNAVYSYRE